jgi:hypothetical protein
MKRGKNRDASEIATQVLAGARALCLVLSCMTCQAPAALTGGVSLFALGTAIAHADDGSDSSDSGDSGGGESSGSDDSGGGEGTGSGDSGGDGGSDGESGSGGSEGSGSGSSGSGHGGDESGGHHEREGSGSGFSVSGFLDALKSHGRVDDVEHGPDGTFSVRYSDGWTERLEGGTYELIDRSGRMVVSRPARTLDEQRLEAAEKSQNWSRRGQ